MSAQEDSPQKFQLHGYLKSMQGLSFDKNFSDVVGTNLLHNRMNLRYDISGHLYSVAEIRSRFFWGEEIRWQPGFGSRLRNPYELVDMSVVWVNRPSFVLQSNVERLYIEYHDADLSLRLGRQRLNWGIATTWNPNDIFNTYNFLDFDYEERAGVDGVKIAYSFNDDFNAELAYSRRENTGTEIAAIKLFYNQWAYDMQLIFGYYNRHLSAGAGWAGSICDAGFKGELQYVDSGLDDLSHFNVVAELDYVFADGWYCNVSALFNNRGIDTVVSDFTKIVFNPSPSSLMPSKWSTIISVAKEITPLIRASLGVVYSPGMSIGIVLPSLSYNISTDIDIDLVWQSFLARFDSNIQAMSHRGFLRMRWSY
jgi:hypothetical protein